MDILHLVDRLEELFNESRTVPFTRNAVVDEDKMLAELRLEREQIEEAILTLERLARGRGRRRGRPPAWLKDAAAAAAAMDSEHQSEDSSLPAEPRRRGRPPGSKSKAATPSES